MEVRRTIPVKLDVNDSGADLLRETIQQFLKAANYVVDAAYDGEWVETRKSVLHETTYSEVRDRTDLHSNHVQSARERAVDALKATLAKWKRGKTASLPTFTSPFVEYNQRNATFHDDHATLATVDGRITAGYVLPDEDRDTPHLQYLFSADYEITGATLHYREHSDEFYLHIRTKADVDAPDPRENGTVLGVDLGVENIAVTSTGIFWSGDELDHWQREYEKRRASLQQCGSHDAHENIRAVGRTETGRFKQMLHRIANELVAEADERGCSHIAFEDLTDIRERMPGAKRIHRWAFRRLYEYVTYKAEPRGIAVEQVEPSNTSRRCSSCGHTAKNNRPSQDTFECQRCEYTNHADYNAAKNVGYRLFRNQTGVGGGAPVGVRLNTGMLNANGVKPLPDLARAGIHGESSRF
ncbi:IS200/IS605 family element transposase accessory protein TnpB [Halostella sp. JP-L12]|uniref:RNA-guided endonuclease InsQ/TnpB family protein n=1 Tax=Halostella TaxID=1843185 RepID=UPI000EF78916|nr:MULTISPECIES: RNA-guided endonuclease TnpB family protein [Halostella]NHN46451.1 IS200/IS605 family element transposase accessory protein TnpB [Halostella sp. JP-L12]